MPSGPIIILGFDRPRYLELFCASLSAQAGVELEQSNIHLMLDGARSRRTGVLYGEQTKLDESATIFKTIFPQGHIHRSAENLGIAMNFARAEQFAFDTLRADVAYFFEDDMVLGPYYLSVLERIWSQGRDMARLGYFSAYGEPSRTSDPDRPKFIPLEHHWSFGLTRRCWEELQPWSRPFYEIYANCDYKWRPHLSLLGCFRDKDVAWGETSQDVVKTAACASLGYARINTDASFAKYIGKVGQSFNEATFQKLGLDRVNLIKSSPKELPPLDDATLQRFIINKRQDMQQFRQDRWAQLMTDASTRMLDPDRIASREDVEWLWRLIMDRLPDQDFYAENVGKTTVRHLRSQLLRSEEARGKMSGQ